MSARTSKERKLAELEEKNKKLKDKVRALDAQVDDCVVRLAKSRVELNEDDRHDRLAALGSFCRAMVDYGTEIKNCLIEIDANEYSIRSLEHELSLSQMFDKPEPQAERYLELIAANGFISPLP